MNVNEYYTLPFAPSVNKTHCGIYTCMECKSQTIYTHNTSLNSVIFAGSLVFSVKAEGFELMWPTLNQHPLCVKLAQVSHKN